MYTVSNLWNSIIGGDHSFESKVEINGVAYDQTKIIEMNVERFVFAEDHPDVGNCLSSEITVSLLLPTETIPRMASIEPFVRVVNTTQQSEWIPQGLYYIDTRETTKNDGVDVLTLHGYDAMLMTEQFYPESSLTFPAVDADVVDEIADTIGVTVDARTWDVMTHAYQISLPADYTMREVLGFIGAMYAGNWVMTYDGELLLVALGGIPPETNYLIDHNDNPITFGGDRILV